MDIEILEKTKIVIIEETNMAAIHNIIFYIYYMYVYFAAMRGIILMQINPKQKPKLFIIVSCKF